MVNGSMKETQSRDSRMDAQDLLLELLRKESPAGRRWPEQAASAVPRENVAVALLDVLDWR
jgi:hypothetical protein